MYFVNTFDVCVEHYSKKFPKLKVYLSDKSHTSDQHVQLYLFGVENTFVLCLLVDGNDCCLM